MMKMMINNKRSKMQSTKKQALHLFLLLNRNYENKVATRPIRTEILMPKTRTGPATVNIFAPTPITQPSDLYSIAGETIEFAKPVIGTREPAPANFPNLLKTLSPVRIAAIPIRIIETTVELETSSRPLNIQ